VVSWAQPDPFTPGITGYTVAAYGEDAEGDFTVESGTCEVAAGEDLTCTVGDLEDQTAYKFTVVAHSAEGDSEESDQSDAVTTLLTPPAPEITKVTRGTTWVMVEFEQPPAAAADEDIEKYIVSATPASGGDAKTCEVDVDADSYACTISDLTPGVEYAVSVVAVTEGGGTSLPSDEEPVTPVGAPTGTGLRNANGLRQIFWKGADRAVWTSVQAADLKWGAPKSMGGIIFAEPEVSRDATGRLQVVVVGGGNIRYFAKETTAGGNEWGPWTPIAGSGLKSTVIGTDSDGKLYLFGVGNDGWVMVNPQTADGVWTAAGWTVLAAGWVSDGITVTNGATGDLVVHGRVFGSVYVITQNADGSWPAAWTKIAAAASAAEAV
jgi:hypothetical protein